MAWMAVAASVIGSVVSGAMKSDAAGTAADAQTASSDAAIAEQRRQYDLARADQLRQYDTARSDTAPYRDAGSSAVVRLRTLLGLGGAGVTGAGTGATPSGYTAGTPPAAQRSVQDIAAELRASGKYATPATQGEFHPGYSSEGIEDPGGYGPGKPAGIDEATLMAEAQRLFAAQPQNVNLPPAGSDVTPGPSDPSQPYGDSPLLRQAPAMRDFTTADLNADPVYQSGLKFGQDEGEKAVNARATQAGAYDSGATLKALTRFANDYGSTKAGESYGRFRGEDTERFNRFNVGQTNAFNRLSGLAGTGQTATGTVTSAGSNMVNAITGAGTNAGNNVSGLLTDAGNARAAGIVGGANAWGGASTGINQAVGNYQSNELLKKILGGKTSGTSGYPSYASYGDDLYNSYGG